jgi:ribosome-associated translation inhibitor RaiA
MHIQVDARIPDASARRESTLLAVSRRLRRHGVSVGWVRVQLSDLNGPRGGVDKLCQVTVVTVGGAVLHASARALQWAAAVDQALRRVATQLSRHPVGSSRSWPRADRLAVTAPALALPV